MEGLAGNGWPIGIQQEYQAGENLFSHGKTKALFLSASQIRIGVADESEKREIVFSLGETAKCTCKGFLQWGECRHIVAATLLAEKNGALKELQRKKAYENGPQLIMAMEDALPKGEYLRLEVTLFVQRKI